MTTMPRVISVVLNWNGLQHTSDCLIALEKQSYRHCGVWVIDNGSTDQSGAELASRQPAWWHLLRLQVNRGFTGGMNAGLRIALSQNADYVWLLNNDAFPEPDCLERLIHFMETNPRVGICTPLLFNANGREQHAGARYHWNNGENRLLLSHELARPDDSTTWLTGTAILIRKVALVRTGLLDPHYFAYWEDVDLCIRMARCGYDLRAVPKAACLHLGGTSSGGSESPFCKYLMVRNAIRFIRKHSPHRCKLGAIIHTIHYWLNLGGTRAMHRQTPSATAIYRGIIAGLLGETGVPKRLRSVLPGESLILTHPWRLCELLARIGHLVEMPREM